MTVQLWRYAPDVLLPDAAPSRPVDLWAPRARDAGSVGVILNGKAHRHRRAGLSMSGLPAQVVCATPGSKAELDRTLADLAERKIGTLVISGGDGTIRDVLSAAWPHFGNAMPRLAIVPFGKTNALATDLGIPRTWRVEDAVQAAASGAIVRRAPLVVSRADDHAPPLRGFLFGAGAFVRAVALAQKTHRFGAFNGLAIGLTLAGAVAQTMFGPRDSIWRKGDLMRVELLGGHVREHPFYLLLSSTLERMPLRVAPFGRVRGGLKVLGVDAPPPPVATTLPFLLAGSEAPWLAARGCRRADTTQLRLQLQSDFILDGEQYAGGDLIIHEGTPIDFVVPAGPC